MRAVRKRMNRLLKRGTKAFRKAMKRIGLYR